MSGTGLKGPGQDAGLRHGPGRAQAGSRGRASRAAKVQGRESGHESLTVDLTCLAAG